MKLFRILYFCIFILFLNQNSFALRQENFQRSPSLESCLHNSLKFSTLLERDRARMKCVEKYKQTLTPIACSKIAQTLEYSNFEDELKSFCMNELPTKTNFHECFQLASSMQYVDNSESAKWSCIKKFERKLSNKECLLASRKMKFSYDRQRIEAFCLSELSQEKKN